MSDKNAKIPTLDSNFRIRKDNEDFVTGEAQSLFTADPATYFVILNILKRVRESVSEFIKFYEDQPELQIILEKAVAGLVKARIIEVVDDKIIVLRQNPTTNLTTSDFDFLPKLLNITAHRIRKNFIKDPKEAFKRGDDLSWRSYPDHPKVRSRINAIVSRFLADLDRLEDDVTNDPEMSSEKVRLVTILNSALEQEDF